MNENETETELLSRPLQLKITPSQDVEIEQAARATRLKKPELVRQALRRGIPILLTALGMEMPAEKHGAENLPVPDSN